jgi:hypothetical protein
MGALCKDGRHSLVFRNFLAPPMSQDQFKLACPVWGKASENKGRPLSPATAAVVAEAIALRIDKGLIRWPAGSRPSRKDVVTVLRVAGIVIAQQRFATARRSRLSFDQEYSTISLLEENGWTRLPSKAIDTRAAVPLKHFMHKTRFATSQTSTQEVDIACGLRNSYVLAMECKATNDETNSVKRINDVIKKAVAWKNHWGNFVRTAALLQGVIAAKDVQRLTDAGVEVFWSHDLDKFKAWLSDQTA